MQSWRITVRYAAGGGARYHMEDVEAATLADALKLAGDRLPAEANASADLAEVRVQAEPERREYAPG